MKKKLEINENNYEGYVELYKTKWIVTDRDKKIMYNTVIGGFLGFIILASILLITRNVSLVASLSCFWYSTNIGYLFVSHKNERKKQKLSLRDKYPYVDLSFNMTEVEDALEKAKILIKKADCLLVDVKSYEQGLVCEKANNIEKLNIDEIIKDSEQNIEVNTDNIENYKNQIEILKKIKQERESQIFDIEAKNVEVQDQEKGLVLKQKED